MNKHFRVTGMLATRLEELGISVPTILRSAALPQNFFQQTRILVSTPELFALWRAIADVSKEASIGLKLGVCREYVSTSLTLRSRYIEQHQNRKWEAGVT